MSLLRFVANQVGRYLSRYTHRTAIGNERLVAVQSDKVLMRVRADATGAKRTTQRTVAIDGPQFIARLLQHVLPSGFKRIRHYGLLAAAAKTCGLGLARRLLGMPAANPCALEQAQDFMRRVAGIDIERCPYCQLGRWRVIEDVPADRAALAVLWPRAARAPP